jgi:hypothetical protein
MKTEELELDERSLKDIIGDMTLELQKCHAFMAVQTNEREARDKLIAEKNKGIGQLVTDFKESLKNIKVIAPPADLSPVTKTLTNGLADISQTIDKGPKPIHRSLKINLFPENNHREHYKLVYGRLIPALLGFIVLIFVCLIVRDSVGAYQAHQQNIDGNNCINAWNYVYNHSGPATQKRMSKALEDASK